MAYTETSGLYDRVFNRFEGEDLISKSDVLQMIANAPVPATDVVEVVRCRACKHFITDAFNRTMCNRLFTMFEMNENDFCSYGETKEGVK